LQLDAATSNHAIIEVLGESNLKSDPRGEYVEVVDYDPTSSAWYGPVDLNATELLAQAFARVRDTLNLTPFRNVVGQFSTSGNSPVRNWTPIGTV